MTLLAQSETTLSLVLTLVGMAVVFTSLVVLAMAVQVLKLASGQRQQRPEPPAAGVGPASPGPASSTPASPQSDPGELVAVLAAAAAAALGRSPQTVRLVRFKRSGDDWQAAGRRALLTSHRPTTQQPRKLRL
jgi:sodium pump decarboxylase gamma subunit